MSVGNGRLTISGGSGISCSGTFDANQSGNTSVTVVHNDTSSQASVNLSNGDVIQDVTLDGFGHVTGLGSTNLDVRYYTQASALTTFAVKAGASSQAFNCSTLTASSSVTATAFFYSSDERLKENVTPVTNALDVIDSLNGVEFDWKEDGKHDIGVIAQEVEAVIPEAVQETDGTKTVSAAPIIAYLIEAVKELKSEVDRLNEQS